MKKKQPDLSIVIPALREERRIGKTLDSLATFLHTDKTLQTLAIEVLVVAADSTDKTHQIVRDHVKDFDSLALLMPGKPVGKGRDVAYGMLRARGKAVVFMDADLATPLKYIPKSYLAFVDGFDVVIATRNLKKHHTNLIRRSFSIGGNILFRIAGGVWVEDSQCGFKLFSAKAAQACFSRLTILGWGFDMEVLAIARANKFRLKTIRANDWKSMPNSTFEVGFLKNSFTMLRDLGHIALNRLKGTYRHTNEH